MNPRTDFPNELHANDLEREDIPASVNSQCQGGTACQLMTGIDSALLRIMAVWQMLPRPIRDEVESMCLHPLSRMSAQSPKCPPENADPLVPKPSTEHGESESAATQDPYRAAHLEQLRRRQCPGCGESEMF